ncbi:MAG TPA: GNAT family N-acetyltransferase [Nocardioides sp.]
MCEAYVPFGNSPEESPALLFGARFGLSTVHQEDHLVLDLPVADECLADLDAAHVASEDYDVVMWGERCPDEHVEAFCEMRTQMARDVPSGEIDYLPHVVDETRLRTDEDRVAAGWISIVAAARRRVDGVMGGYSMLVLPRGGELAMQDDTLVMPEHRGRRLGTRLKLATLQVLTRNHPERRALHTWTEPENHAMYRTNTDFGYVARERMYEVQRKAPQE